MEAIVTGSEIESESFARTLKRRVELNELIRIREVVDFFRRVWCPCNKCFATAVSLMCLKIFLTF